MIEETATVIRTAKDVAWVQTRRKTACNGCSLNKGCGVSALDKLLGDRNTTLKTIDPLSSRPGDEVVIGLEEKALLKGSVAVYIVPLLAMILSAIAGSTMVAPWLGLPPEGSSILLALLGLLAGYGWVATFSRSIKYNPDYQPVILRKTDQNAVTGQCIPIAKI